MQRTIVQRADISGDAVAELKIWLGISRPDEDSLLIELINASLDLCEAFTGQSPLQQTAEERLSADRGSYILSSRPVTTLLSAELVAQDGTRNALAASEFDFTIESDGHATFKLKSDFKGQAIALQIAAGIAADWAQLPSALKQGVIWMAAHHYRDRDFSSDAKRTVYPPASVAALWRPWRSIRLT